ALSTPAASVASRSSTQGGSAAAPSASPEAFRKSRREAPTRACGPFFSRDTAPLAPKSKPRILSRYRTKGNRQSGSSPLHGTAAGAGRALRAFLDIRGVHRIMTFRLKRREKRMFLDVKELAVRKMRIRKSYAPGGVDFHSGEFRQVEPLEVRA